MTKQKRIVITDKFIISREKPLSKFETIWDSKAQMKALHYKSGGWIFWGYSWFGPLSQTILWKLGRWDRNTFNSADARTKYRADKSTFIDKGIDPRVEKKQRKLLNYQKQLREADRSIFQKLIQKYVEAEFPRVKDIGNTTRRSAQSMSYALIGRKRTKKLKFYDDDKGSGHVLRKDENLRSWDEFWANNKNEKADCIYDSALGHSFIEEVNTARCKAYINKSITISSRKFARQTISVVITWGIDTGYFGESPPANPCFNVSIRREKTPKTRGKNLVYSQEELKRIWQACDKFIDKYPFQTSAIKLLSVTSLRKEEALELKWDYVQESTGLIDLPSAVTKIHENQDIDINAHIQFVLDEIKALRKKYSWAMFLPWLFPSFRVKNKNTRPHYSKKFPHKSHLQDIRNCWNAVKLEAKVDGKTSRMKKTHHNLSNEVVSDPYDLIGLTRHTNTAVLEKHYLRHDADKRKQQSKLLDLKFKLIKS